MPMLIPAPMLILRPGLRSYTSNNNLHTSIVSHDIQQCYRVRSYESDNTTLIGHAAAWSDKNMGGVGEICTLSERPISSFF